MSLKQMIVKDYNPKWSFAPTFDQMPGFELQVESQLGLEPACNYVLEKAVSDGSPFAAQTDFRYCL